MKIVALMENTASRPDVCAEHGLSLYVETNGRRILFDAGQTADFAQNAGRLDVNLANVDLAVLSHGHYDHGGGIRQFLRVNDHAPVYVNRHAFCDCWHGEDHYIGVDASLACENRIVLTDDVCRIADGLTLHTCNAMERRYPFPAFGLTVRQADHTFQPDSFLHEQYLLAEENGRRIVLSGCSHKGILNILEWFHPDVLIGGFHLMKMDPIADRDALLSMADALNAYHTTYYTCHCTGLAPYQVLKSRMGEKLHYLSAGDTVDFS